MIVSFEDLTVGQPLGPYRRHTDLEAWNRYAAVNDEFVTIHMDDDAARARGEKGVLGMGNLRLAYLHCLLFNWIGDEASISRFSIQHRGINYKNDTLTANGKVAGKRIENGECLVDLDLWVENQRGEQVDAAWATVVLSAKGS